MENASQAQPSHCVWRSGASGARPIMAHGCRPPVASPACPSFGLFFFLDSHGSPHGSGDGDRHHPRGRGRLSIVEKRGSTGPDGTGNKWNLPKRGQAENPVRMRMGSAVAPSSTKGAIGACSLLMNSRGCPLFSGVADAPNLGSAELWTQAPDDTRPHSRLGRS